MACGEWALMLDQDRPSRRPLLYRVLRDAAERSAENATPRQVLALSCRDPGRRVDPHSGTVAFDSVEEAMEFAGKFSAAVAAAGVAASPRVTLCKAGLPILPMESRKDALLRADERAAAVTRPLEPGFHAWTSACLKGHVVRRGVSPLTPTREHAGRLAERRK